MIDFLGSDFYRWKNFCLFCMNIDIDIDRKKKQQKILAMYGFILLVIIVLFVLWVTPGASCTNGKKDGAETGVDCGGVCGECPEKVVAQDILFQKTAFVSDGQGKYDIAVWLENPNDLFGAKTVSGSFSLIGSGGKILKDIPATSFLLPKEQKYILKQGVESSEPIESVSWKTGTVNWMKMNRITDLRLSVTDRKYEEISSGIGFSKVTGLLRNDSLYDWNNVGVTVLLFDGSGNLLATHGTSRQTFRSGEKWDFQLIFPERFPGNVQSLSVQAETDVYDNDNFLRAALPGGAFQSQ